MASEDGPPTDLEMELRRNLAVCVCSHTYMQHDDEARLKCIVCITCQSFKENF